MVHWDKALNQMYGADAPVNITSHHDIYMDRVRRNHFYYKSQLPDSNSAFIKHIFNQEILTEQFVHNYHGMKIYCLPSKLKLLTQYSVTGDGTWSPCRFISEKQCYILCCNIRKDNKVLTIPVLYALCKTFTVRNYCNILDFAKEKYFEYYGEQFFIKQFHLDCEIAVLNAVKLAFPNCVITYCNVHILRSISKHFKKNLGAHFYKTKLFLEMFKVITGSFYLDFSNKELIQEFFKILDSFVPRTGLYNSKFTSGIRNIIKYLKTNFYGYRARFPPKYWDYRNLALTDKCSH